jgi:hypothetical protein
MRSEQEMLDLILDTTRNDERIRAVIMCWLGGTAPCYACRAAVYIRAFRIASAKCWGRASRKAAAAAMWPMR